MESQEVRKVFLDFFKSKEHRYVKSAPMVVKDDPSLMFINAGMNQFKDYFLGNRKAENKRVTNTQKCLRVSGKHNDLEEVGMDTYHHTMFEMLGNWSFGDYFKKEAIEWAWELLTEVYKIDKTKLYVTVFGGDKKDGLESDQEAKEIWKKLIPEDRILYGSKKDNFWEMGDIGPCGPCSEIHVDIRSDEEKKLIPGDQLVNQDHPQVIEIWNLVFIEFKRKANGDLSQLPDKHVDTGMGFERLCMVLQNKTSNYDTDVFQSLINKIAAVSNKKYGDDIQTDIALRVIADHIRAVSFAIADGQMPSNNKAGYVIRRILRRAIRYSYAFLDIKKPFMAAIIPVLVKQMEDVFPEIKAQESLIINVITEEEESFLKTLANGIQKFNKYISKPNKNKTLDGAFCFELYDTLGFPIDLTALMAKEEGWEIDFKEFYKLLEEQKKRSRADAVQQTGDWIVLIEDKEEEFLGYDYLENQVKITRYREVVVKDKKLYHLVFNFTPFYSESGGQIGDTGCIEAGGHKTRIVNTVKENDLAIHIATELPKYIDASFMAYVDKQRREDITANHTATHLLHSALRQILGAHVEQKGSLVEEKYLRFDFSHYQKMTDEQIKEVEDNVNAIIRQNIELEESREIPMRLAREMGATALFGEKYGDLVRVIKYADSIELCGGTHAQSTGKIGFFKIISEGSIASGIRRIEAKTSAHAIDYINTKIEVLNNINKEFANSKDIFKSVTTLKEENKGLLKKIEELEKDKVKQLLDSFVKDIEDKGSYSILIKKQEINAASAKDIAFRLSQKIENLIVVIGHFEENKVGITIKIDENLCIEKDLDASAMIRDIAKHIKGGGGGQKHFATAGGKDLNGLDDALASVKKYFE